MAKGNTVHRPTRLYHKHFKVLRGAATEAILQGRDNTLFRLPNPPEGMVREWPSGFPNVFIHEWGVETTVWGCGSKLLLNWLYATKRSPYNAKQVYDWMQLFHIRRERDWVMDILDEYEKGNW